MEVELDVESIIDNEEGCFKRRSRSEIMFTEHAGLRGLQRNVPDAKCKEVIENGNREPADYGRWKFCGDGVTIITDPEERYVVTLWRTPGHGIVLKKVEITPEMAEAHVKAVKKLKEKSTWTSHTVAVVDQSGSMREIDMDKLVMRSDLVWLNLAVTVVAKCLKNGDRKETDVLSVISMRDHSEVVIKNQPFDWVLYNKLVDLLENSQPSGGGCYVPALETATELLHSNRHRHCALSLLFLSDGQPSDKIKRGDDGSAYERLMIQYATEKIAELASTVGKRLSVCGVGIGKSCKHEFRIINAMLKEAAQYECPVCFEPSCVSSRQLATALLTTTQNTTTTKTHISELADQEVLREFKKQPLREVGQGELTDTWTIVKMQKIVDPHSRQVKRTIVRTRWVHGEGWVQHYGNKIFVHPDAVGVAFETRWFGEGKERLVKEFREVDKHQRFVGPSYVAKDSITVHRDGRKHTDMKAFHKKFCQTHLLAQEAANKFNKLVRNCSLRDLVPEIQFLECSVYMLHLENGEREGFLVEPMLEFQRYPYQKFNDNQGGLNLRSCDGRQTRLLNQFRPHGSELETIYEESDDEETEIEDEYSFGLDTMFEEIKMEEECSVLSTTITPQVFSCFSCYYFYQKKLVCDLQGIYDKSNAVYRLTDPVIHQSRSRTSVFQEKYGRTDRGDVGIDDFKKTHRCVPLCTELRKLLWNERRGRNKTEIKNESHFPNAD